MTLGMGDTAWRTKSSSCSTAAGECCLLYSARAAGLARILDMSSCLFAFAGTEVADFVRMSLRSTTLRALLDVPDDEQAWLRDGGNNVQF